MKSETNFSKLRSLYSVLVAISAMMLFVACDNDKGSEPPLPPEPLTEVLRPVLTDGKRWVIEETSMGLHTDNSTTTVWNKFVDGEMMAGGYNAKIVRACYQDGRELDIPEVLREEDGKVYKFWQWNDGANIEYGNLVASKRELWGLSYDITPQSYMDILLDKEFIQLESRGTIVLQGKTRRAVKIRHEHIYMYHDVYYDYWVEGIGPLFGWHPDYRTYSVMPTSSPDNIHWYVLLECYDGDEKIYDHREFREDLYVPEVTFTENDR